PLPAALVSCERCTTGLSLMAIDLSGKLLSLLKDAVPNLSRVALLFDRTNPFKQRTIKSFGGAAQALGVSLSSAEISKPDDIEPVFDKIAQEHADGVVIPNGSSMVFNERCTNWCGAYRTQAASVGPIRRVGSARPPDVVRAGLP